VRAREVLTRARARRDELVAVSGDESTDVLLDDLAPLLAVLLTDLSDRQRHVARLLLLDGLRQADVADHLNVTRATVSVLADRGRVREIGRLARALAALLRDGIARSAGSVGVA
jgi:DNA-directed RNA polymerase specialized sigma24 family protein